MSQATSDQDHLTSPRHTAWAHAAELGPLITLGVFAAGALASAVTAPVAAVALVALAAAGALVVACCVLAPSALSAAWGSACAVCGCGWVAYATVAGPWTWTAGAALAVPAVILAPLYPAVRVRELAAAELARQAAEADRDARQAAKWPRHLAKLGHDGVTYAGRDDTLCGYAVRLRLPGSGRVTYSALAGSTERLEVAAKARHGSLRFERGHRAHEVVLHVAERDVLAETIPYPAEAGHLTINRPLPVGVYEDGRVCTVTLREVATLIVGLRGSGKSTLLSVLLAQLARCVDVLVFAIDLKGGRMAAPWLAPWLAGQTPAPVIDWLATTREEAEVMLRALLRAVDARSRSGAGGEKITPAARQPAIILVADEIAMIFGMGMGGPRTSADGVTNATLASLATQLVMTGRSEAVDLIMATQRGTVTMTGSGDMKSQCGLRIGLGVATEADARLIIPDDVRIAADLARLSHPGSGIVQQGRNGRVLPVKFYRLEHDDIAGLARAGGHIRPEPDEVLAAALGPEYAERWSAERAGHLPGVGQLVPAGAPRVTAPPGTTKDEFMRIVAGLGPLEGFGPAPAAEDEAGHPARRRMLALLREAGVRGMTPLALGEALAAEGHTPARQTVQRWLAEDEAAGKVTRAKYGRWKAAA